MSVNGAAVAERPKPIEDDLPEDTGVRPYRWTVDELFEAVEKGVFRHPERLELLDGEVIEQITQSVPHFDAVQLCAHYLPKAFGPPCSVRQQGRWVLSPTDYVEPDALVVRGSFRDYLGRDPRVEEVLLVIEVADTSLRQDRGRKAAKFARIGVPEYWIVNLPERQVEVFRDPGEMPESRWGYGYRSVSTHSESAAVSPLASPTGQVAVSDLLPSDPQLSSVAS